MATTYQMFQRLHTCFTEGLWEEAITLCDQLEEEDRLPTEELQIMQRHSKLYAQFAKNEFSFGDHLRYADRLCMSAHASITYPRFCFLCSYVMLCGLRQGFSEIYLSQADYLRSMESSLSFLALNGETISEEERENPLLACFPDFGFLETLKAASHPNAAPVKVEGFLVEEGCLLRYTGKESSVVVPIGVLSIGDGAFAHATQPIEEVVLPEGLLSIGDFAFHDVSHNQPGFCSRHLKRVVTPSSLRSIGESAFLQCSRLEEIDLSMVTHLKKDVFKWCGSLRKVDLSSLVQMGTSVFWSCWELEEVKNFPDCEEILEQTFRDCTKLKAFAMPPSVRRIGSMAFSGCGTLEQLDLSRVEEMLWYAVSHCSQLTELTLSPNLKKIPPYAFRSCSSLVSITLPQQLESILMEAFQNCTALSSVTFPPSLREISQSAFCGCCSLEKVSLPAGLQRLPELLFAGCEQLKIVELSEGLTTIEKSAFEGCKALEVCALPSTVATLGNNAFKGCSCLTEIDLRQVRKIGNGCFNGCKNLKQVMVSSGAEIHAKAFTGIRGLQIEFIE